MSTYLGSSRSYLVGRNPLKTLILPRLLPRFFTVVPLVYKLLKTLSIPNLPRFYYAHPHTPIALAGALGSATGHFRRLASADKGRDGGASDAKGARLR
jgi:hypothetical protein